MRVQLKNIMAAFLTRYDGWLYNSALTKLIYLLDIESVLRYGSQVTEISWQRNYFGPFVWDIIDCAQRDIEHFRVVEEDGKRRICLLKSPYGGNAIGDDRIEELILCIVAACPNPKERFSDFKDYVYETAPMVLSPGFGPLNIEDAMSAQRTVDEVTGDLFGDPEWDDAFKYLAAN